MSRTVAEFCDDSPDTIEALRVAESLAPLAPVERTRIKRMLHSAMLFRYNETRVAARVPPWSKRYKFAARRVVRLLAFEKRCMEALSR